MAVASGRTWCFPDQLVLAKPTTLVECGETAVPSPRTLSRWFPRFCMKRNVGNDLNRTSCKSAETTEMNSVARMSHHHGSFRGDHYETVIAFDRGPRIAVVRR
jgi:hypothetical protein